MYKPHKNWARQALGLFQSILPAGGKILLVFILVAFLLPANPSIEAVSGSYLPGTNSPVKAGQPLKTSVFQSGNNVYLPAMSYILPPTDWPMSGANPQRTSWTAAEVRGSLRPAWYKHFDAYISQKVQIIAASNMLFISASDGLHALDAANGNERWFYPTDMPLGNSPTYSSGVLFVGGYDRKIHAINAANGQLIWQFTAGAGFATNPLAVEGLVIAGNRDGYMYAINSQGRLAWRYKTDGPILFSAAYKDGVIYFASNDMYAYALKASTGELVWKSGKLPGNSFHSWWPVIYNQYVVFSGSYNYRSVNPFATSHLALDMAAYPSNAAENSLIGPLGSEPGNWSPGTPTINASRISQYFETYPLRRTTIVLEQASGHELTYDSNGNGRPEYAPFLYQGTYSGSRYPAAVGADNVLYQANSYIYKPYIPMGHITGWKFGTQFISRPTSEVNAADEPMGYAIGGTTVYWKRCCDRKAGAFSLNGDYRYNYFDEGNGLRKTLPNLFAEGWDFSAWKHGDTTPPIPYNGRVYTINNNAVVALATNGLSPVLPNDEYRGIHTGVDVSSIERTNTLIGLNTKATFNSNSWPLLFQQERYYELGEEPTTRARHFRLFEVAGSAASAASAVNSSGNVITSTFSGGTLTTQLSGRTPTVLLNNTSAQYRLLGEMVGIAYPTSAGVVVRTGSASITGSALSESWVMVWDDTSTHRWMPMVISLGRRPNQITFASTGLTMSYTGAAGYAGVTPLYGMSSPKPTEETSWPASGLPATTINRIRMLNQASKAFPNGSTDTMNVDGQTGDVTITYTYNPRITITDDWNTPQMPIAYLPTQMALAAWNGSTIQINGQPLSSCGGCIDLGFITPLGRVAGVQNANAITVRLPGIARYWRQLPAGLSGGTPGDPLYDRLLEEIQKILTAGHMLPGYGDFGIWDAKASNRLGILLADYWHNPSELYYTLVRALPLLPSNMQTQVRSYLQSEYQTYPADSISHTGWETGTHRGAFSLPQEVIADTYAPCGNCNSQDNMQENLYGSWLYAQQFPDRMTSIFASAGPKLDLTPQYNQSMAYKLNLQIAGYIGYLQMARQQPTPPNVSAVEKTMVDLFVLRAALSKYPFALAQMGFEYGSLQFAVRTYAPNMPDTLFAARAIGTLWSQLPLYGFPIDILYGLSGGPTGGGYGFGIDYVNLTPETADFLSQYARNEVAATVADYEKRTPYWFVSQSEEGAGEGIVVPIYDSIAMFQAKALILKQNRSQLEPYIDVPAFPIGDLYYIQNLISTITAE